MPALATLTGPERLILIADIAAGASRRTVARITDLDHRLQAEIPARLLGGQTTVQRVAFRDCPYTQTRVWTGTFVDPDRAMIWDPHSSAPLAMWPNRMLTIDDELYSDTLGDWITSRVFTGPLTGFRGDREIALTAVGKERLAQRPLGKVMKFAAGTHVIKVMRALLEETGETKFDLPDFRPQLHKKLILDEQANAWRAVQRLARAHDWQAYYPGNGRFTVRRLPGNVSMVWKPATSGGLLLGQPEVSFEVGEGFHNRWEFRGHRPHGGGRQVHGEWQPNKAHPLSPDAMQRGGEDQAFTAYRHNPKLSTNAKADQKARRVGKDHLRQTVSAELEVMPFPITEGDKHAVYSDRYGRVTFRVDSFVMPHGPQAQPEMLVNRIRRLQHAPQSLR